MLGQTVIFLDEQFMRVYQGEAVSSGLLAGLCDGDYVRHIGAELDVDRLCGNGLDGTGDCGCSLRVRSECHSSVVDIGAGDIDLDDADLIHGVYEGTAVGIFIDGKTADVGYDLLVENLRKGRKLFGDDCVDSGILESD